MNKFTVIIDEKISGAFGVAKLEGTLDIFSFKELKDTVSAWFENRIQPRLIFDMTRLDYVGSSGWSVLFLLSALATHRRGRVVAFGISPKLLHALDILSSQKRTLLIAGSFEEAIKRLDEELPKE
jgi:anti-anti-sigma factor